MSVEWFDLGARLHAAQTNRPAPRLLRAPLLPAPHPVAVRATATRRVIEVTAAAPGSDPITVPGTDALALLGDLGVTTDAATPATLVTADPATLAVLADLTATRREREDVTAHIGWWLDRADYPGGRAVADVMAGCRARWLTGLTPKAERSAGVWREWLGVTDRTVAGVLDLYAAVTAGQPLTHLDVLAEDDLYSWGLTRTGYQNGRDWRIRDTPARAALSLRSRCDAADLYADALLCDPLWRTRAVHTGHVVTGVATVHADKLKRADVRCERIDTRLRPGKVLTGWVGGPSAEAPPFTATVDTAAMRGGALTLTLSGLTGAVPATGQRVTLHERGPNVWGQRRSRSTYAALYRRRSSWLSTGRTPVPSRRDVPLDVLVAGAERDESEDGQ